MKGWKPAFRLSKGRAAGKIKGLGAVWKEGPPAQDSRKVNEIIVGWGQGRSLVAFEGKRREGMLSRAASQRRPSGWAKPKLWGRRDNYSSETGQGEKFPNCHSGE